MEVLTYDGRKIGTVNVYHVQHPSFQKMGAIQFDGLASLLLVADPSHNGTVECPYFGRETAQQFRARMEQWKFAIYLSPESEDSHEGGPLGIKARRDVDAI